MADSSSTPSAPSNSAPSAPATATLGTNAAGQAASAQIHAKNAPKAPNQAPATSSAPKQAAQAQATINDPKASPAAKQAAQKTLKKLTLKVDGQDYTENLPFEIPDTQEARDFMTRELQMARMGQKRAQHAATLEKEVKQLIDDIRTDPFKVLQDPAIKVDVKDAIRKYIEKEIENSNKSPEQLALEAAKEELRLLKAQQDHEKQTREQQERQALADKYEREFDDQITQALETNKIPRSEAAVKKILDYAQLAVQAGKDVSINDIIPFVREELVNDYRAHARNLPDESLEEFFGKDLVDRLRKVSVKRVKAAQANPAVRAAGKVPDAGRTPVKEEKPAEKISYKKFFKPW